MRLKSSLEVQTRSPWIQSTVSFKAGLRVFLIEAVFNIISQIKKAFFHGTVWRYLELFLSGAFMVPAPRIHSHRRSSGSVHSSENFSWDNLSRLE